MLTEEKEAWFEKILDSGKYNEVFEKAKKRDQGGDQLILEFVSYLMGVIKTTDRRRNMTAAERNIFDHNAERETHIFNCITKRMPKELLDSSGGTETIELRTAKVLAKMPIKHALNTTILNAQPDAVFWFLHEEDIQDLTREMTEFDDGSFLIGKEV